MIPVLIFSKDRACQLDALLSSLEENGSEVFGPVSVVWAASDETYVAGYRRCIGEHPTVTFAKEGNFQDDVQDWLRFHSGGLIAFMVDDDILFSPVGAAVEVAMADEQILTFSLRMGRNCTNCFPLYREQAEPQFTGRDVFLTWEWAGADGDWSYPFSLDGNVFRRDDILERLDEQAWGNPNQIEDVLARGHTMAQARPLMACYHNSVLVGLPLNIVNTTHQSNRHGAVHSAEDLNARYLRGDRIDIAPFMKLTPDAAHIEVDLQWR